MEFLDEFYSCCLQDLDVYREYSSVVLEQIQNDFKWLKKGIGKLLAE